MHVLPLAPGVQKPTDVIPILLYTYKKARYEPRWGDPVTCIDAAKRLAVANLAEISIAIGLTPSPVDDLRKVRNFVAHRNKQKALDVKAVALSLRLPSAADADRIVGHTVPPGIPLLERWIEELRVMADFAIR
jgi:hypothetical protein